MKLLNRSLLYLSLTFLVIIGVWSVIFYLNIKDEIRDSIDDGLDNNRLLILQKTKTDASLFLQNEFSGNNFEIHPISKQKALAFRDIYKDTLMYRLNEDDLEPVRILHSAFEHHDHYYHLKIISSLIEEDDLIEDSFWSIIWLFLILITSVIIINNIVLGKIWKPFYEILERLKTYRLDKDEAALNIPTKTKEFIQLQHASNALFLHAKKSFTAQKQFTENASHELQTPIAIIINKLELLLESEHLTENDAKTIAEVITIADRMKRLNNSLLLMAKIENKQFLDINTVSINKVSKDFLAHYKELTDYRKLAFQLEETDHCSVNMNSALAEILISNLIKNAVFHNKPHSDITIKITKQEFIISNQGDTTALDSKLIFNRFEKDASKTNSTGLGLAICKTICDAYNISITYDFTEHKHSFKINFKNIITHN
ncbi:PorY family sensor histidine kinase [Winogradskyella sp. PC D3.3]